MCQGHIVLNIEHEKKSYKSPCEGVYVTFLCTSLRGSIPIIYTHHIEFPKPMMAPCTVFPPFPCLIPTPAQETEEDMSATTSEGWGNTPTSYLKGDSKELSPLATPTPSPPNQTPPTPTPPSPTTEPDEPTPMPSQPPPKQYVTMHHIIM